MPPGYPVGRPRWLVTPMPGLYLALVVAWILLLGVLRGVLHTRRGGAVPIRLDHPLGSAQWWVQWVSMLGWVLMLAAPLADLAGMRAIRVVDRTGVHLTGVVLVAIGVAVTMVSQQAMGASWRGDVDHSVETLLVTAGPFRVVRNPIFTGTAITTGGLALIVPNIFAIAMVIVQLAILQVQVKLVEEPYLQRVHGEAYRRYAQRTGRFVPGVGRGLADP